MYPKIYMPNNCRSLSFLSCNLDRSVIKLKRRNKLNKFIVLLPQFANHKQAGVHPLSGENTNLR